MSLDSHSQYAVLSGFSTYMQRTRRDPSQYFYVHSVNEPTSISARNNSNNLSTTVLTQFAELDKTFRTKTHNLYATESTGMCRGS